MRMKAKIHDRTNMSFTGSKVLKSIMDTTTPGMDILVRESIQNSMDAVLPKLPYGRVSFNYGEFISKDLSSKLDLIESKVNSIYTNDKYEYLAISDTNTCGLLGEPYLDLDDDTKPHNLYNLVYDFMNGKEDDNAGGSWGIGKSVYYRYGAGICFYYSRTFENNKYIHKLTGALIQSEKLDNCLLGKKSSGIAFFGDLDEIGSPIPIYNESEIKEFLNVFNLKPFENDKTGTIVIIPYLNKNELMGHRINHNYCSWDHDVIQSLKMSIQRWYFPKLNNKKYNGKYLICGINNEKLELNEFFKVLQELYNEEYVDAHYENITHKNICNGKEILGKLKYKKFTKEELFVETAPNNLPSPYVMLDIEEDNLEGNQEILFYTRKPGMIITYDVDKFGKFNIMNDEYLLGIFVLNDDLIISDEYLGKYIRLTEKANHKEWVDGNFVDFPYFSKNKPFTKICNSIKRKLSEQFSSNNIINIDGAHSVYQKKLGKKLMPPEDYGDRPQPPKRTNPPGPKIPGPSKVKQIASFFNGFKDELLSYSFEVLLKPQQHFECELNVKTANKIYSFNEWEELGFEFPCVFRQYEMDEYSVDKNYFPLGLKKDINSDFLRIMGKRDANKKDIFLFTGIKTDKNNICGFKVSNETNNEIKFRINLLVEPKDLSCSIMFDSKIKAGGIKNE